MSLTQSHGGQATWRQRITAPPDLMAGKASIRALSVEVEQVLRALADGIPVLDLLKDYPGLEEADIAACLAYAAELAATLAAPPSAEGLAVPAGTPLATTGGGTPPPVPAAPSITLEAGMPPPSSSPAQAVTLLSGPAMTGSSAAPYPDIAGYEILGELGRGGMGVVYKARQIDLNRLVALKMILGGGHAGSQVIARFRTEAEAVARLQHPGIVQIYETGEHGGLPFFSLELVVGGSLANRLDGSPLPAKQAAALIESVARAVQHAHEHGIIHRDLKPANVLLALRQGLAEAPEGDGPAVWESYEPKITDFGLAKLLESNRGQTLSGEILGTPSYLAPEQAAGQSKAVGPAVDVYALGAILYELLTGRPPFQAATPMDVVLQVLEQEPLGVRQLNPKVPGDLDTICLKCLRKDRGQRYASAAALAEDLRRFRHGEPIKARPPGVLEWANRWVKRHQILVLAYLVAFCAFVLFLKLYDVFLPYIFGATEISASDFYYGVLPLALAVLLAFIRADLRAVTFSTFPLALGSGLWWYYVLDARLNKEGSAWLWQALISSGLLGTVVGILLRNWRSALLWQLPNIAIWASVAWYSGHSIQPILTGIFHGLLLGVISRVVAWGLHREKAASVLGTLIGAWAGLVVADLYVANLRGLLIDSGLGKIPFSNLSLYVEIFIAYLGGIAMALLLGKRPSAA